MSNYSSEITAWYEAIQYRAPPASELTSFEAQLTAGVITTAQAVAQIEASTYTQNYVDPVIREYQAAFGRVPDQAGAAYWVGQVAANPANLAVLSTTFANSAEFMADYGASATTPASSTLVTALYTNVLGRVPDAAGLAYWSSQPLDAAQLLQAFAQSAEFITDTTPYVIQFQNAEVAGTEPTSGSLYNQAITGGIAANTYTITYGAPTTFSFTGTLGGQPITGTIAGGPTGPISSTEAAGNSNVTINAALGPEQLPEHRFHRHQQCVERRLHHRWQLHQLHLPRLQFRADGLEHCGCPDLEHSSQRELCGLHQVLWQNHQLHGRRGAGQRHQRPPDREFQR